MICDQERLERIRSAIQDAGWDALICGLPSNVLLLSGYWPVLGTSLAIATRDGQIGLVVPEDERELAEMGWANELRVFRGGSLDEIKTPAEQVRAPLAQLVETLHVGRVIGHERGAFFQTSSYAAMQIFGGALPEILAEALPGVSLVPADDRLRQLRSVATPCELARIRLACRIAQKAFVTGARSLRPGLTETEAAVLFRNPLSTAGVGFEGVERADGFTYCMSGPNSAQAHAAYQRSRTRALAAGDLALLHCNSYADGYWTDITRTFCLGEPDETKRRMYNAIFAAREAALNAIVPGAKLSDVDRAAREVMREHGYAKEFKHATSHGVGFSAINHPAHPRIHPASAERLEKGMVFNVEPGIYVEGYGGMRHCDMVAVNDRGAELLTPFQARLKELAIA